MESSIVQIKTCKYCTKQLEVCTEEGLECTNCKQFVHLKCLKRGSVPGGLTGDVFYDFTCSECSKNDTESFVRMKMSWLQILCLVLHHLQIVSPGLARRGFFHWRHHIAAFIDRHWTVLAADVKKKKKWLGTIAGALSHYSGYIFISGTSVFNEPAWWALFHPKVTPQVLSTTYFQFLHQKQTMKGNKEKVPPDIELFEAILHSTVKNEEVLQHFPIHPPASALTQQEQDSDMTDVIKITEGLLKAVSTLTTSDTVKRQHNSPLLGNPRKAMKMNQDDFVKSLGGPDYQEIPVHATSTVLKRQPDSKPKELKLLDPFCHYNTSLNNTSKVGGLSLHAKLTGGIKQDQILSPYSQIYLKPYICRDSLTFPSWLQLMAEIQLAVNEKHTDYRLPPRAPIDYTYVQPEHIPAINSLCNQYFWPGIDMTDSLHYPDFSCVAMYKRLIIGFAFLVPNVKATENYLSFIFTRPYWRNCGIAKFMLYHLIQTSLGKDITLHVSLNSPALFLYQKFGFKVEDVVLDFYDKYYRFDVKECKHAFFCRLER